MTLSVYAAVLIAVLVAVAVKKMRRRSTRRTGTVGPAAAGAFYELLNDGRRNAVEIVVEQKAGYRVAEHADDAPPEER